MKYFRLVFSIISFLLVSTYASLGFSKGSDLSFTGLVAAVDQVNSTEGKVTISIHGIEFAIIVNGDTEIHSDADEIELADISVGDFVKMNSFFSGEGIAAEEIEILDQRSEQFRLRGAISAVDTIGDETAITVMGVDIIIDSSTEISVRGSGAEILPADLMAGDLVNVRGGSTNGLLVATALHVGVREQGDIEIEGVIVEMSEASIKVDINNGASLRAIIDENTSIGGTLELGAFVEVEGRFNTGLSIIASEIVVDVDGDGDADDEEQSSSGRGDDLNVVQAGAEINLVSDGSDINGKAETKYVEEAGEVEQELEIELEDAPVDTTYDIVVYFGNESVEFGSFTTNSFGSAEAEYKTNPDESGELPLSDLLPEGLDVRDITAVEIYLGGDVLLEGEF